MPRGLIRVHSIDVEQIDGPIGNMVRGLVKGHAQECREALVLDVMPL